MNGRQKSLPEGLQPSPLASPDVTLPQFSVRQETYLQPKRRKPESHSSGEPLSVSHMPSRATAILNPHRPSIPSAPGVPEYSGPYRGLKKSS